MTGAMLVFPGRPSERPPRRARVHRILTLGLEGVWVEDGDFEVED